jgi:YidC/Oxa1 family membrane protein insertase
VLSKLGSVSLDPAAIAAIPVWDQYVTGLEHVLDFLARTFNSGGIAIIVFTIIVKTLLLPLTVKAIRSSKSMQEMQPKIKELQKKYGKDRQRLSQETMALYQQHQINPLAGCLPMLIQIPIFFGVYRAISNISSGGAEGFSSAWTGSFLWLESLNQSDPYKILPIMAGVFQFVQTRMSRPSGQGKPSDPQQAMMNTMMNFMPLMVVVFGWTFAAGPVIYWVTQSVYSVVQQWLIAGWGSMKDWFPMLPDLPEHRQLGYKAPRNLDEVVVVTGADGKPVPQGKVMGWMHRKAEEAQDQRKRADEQRAQKTTGTSAGGKSGSSSGAKSGKNRAVRPKMASADEDDGTMAESPAPAMKPPRPIKRASSKARAPENGVDVADGLDASVEAEAAPVAGPAPRKIKSSQRRPKPGSGTGSGS